MDDSDYHSSSRNNTHDYDETTHEISPTQVQDGMVDQILNRAREGRERLAQMRRSTQASTESPTTLMIPEAHTLAQEPQRELVATGVGSTDTPRRPGEGNV